MDYEKRSQDGAMSADVGKTRASAVPLSPTAINALKDRSNALRERIALCDREIESLVGRLAESHGLREHDRRTLNALMIDISLVDR